MLKGLWQSCTHTQFLLTNTQCATGKICTCDIEDALKDICNSFFPMATNYLTQFLRHSAELKWVTETYSIVKSKGKFLYSAVSSPQDRSKHFTLYFPGKSVQSLYLNFSGKYSAMLQLMHEGCSYRYPPLAIARCSFIQLSELEQCRMKKLSNGLTSQHRM